MDLVQRQRVSQLVEQMRVGGGCGERKHEHPTDQPEFFELFHVVGDYDLPTAVPTLRGSIGDWP